MVIPITNKPEKDLEDQTVGGKLLGKTMRFVSGVLFARDAGDGSVESEKHVKGKEREMDRNRDIILILILKSGKKRVWEETTKVVADRGEG
jgi:hypothetical protein